MAQCPVDKAQMIPATAEGHAGLRCGTCAGLWLPQAYIDSLRHDRHFDPAAFRQQLRDGATGGIGKHCPAGCGKLNVSKLRETQLDWCPTCDGVWFDSGELQSVLENHPRVGSVSAPRLGAWAAADAALLIISMFG
jgi:Zn-finger nucleic acid-binding protein